MPPKRNLLEIAKVNFLSLVDRPANQHSHAVIHKRDGETKDLRSQFGAMFKGFLDRLAKIGAEGTTPEQIAKDAVSFQQMSALDRLWTLGSSLQSSIASIVGDAEQSAESKQKLIDASLSQYRDAVLALNTDDAAFQALEESGETATVKKDDYSGDVMKRACPDCGADMGTATTCPQCGYTAPPITKAVEDGTTPQPPAAAPRAGEHGVMIKSEEGTTMHKRTPQTFTDLAAANTFVATVMDELNQAITKRDELQSEIDAAKDPLAHVTKGMPPAAATLVRNQHAELENLRKSNAERARTERIAKAVGKEDLTADERTALSVVFKALDGEPVTAEDRTKAEDFFATMFKQYNAMADELEGLDLGIVGGADGAELDDAGVEAAVTKRAGELMAADKTLTRPQAITKAYEENPALYDAHSSTEAVPA